MPAEQLLPEDPARASAPVSTTPVAAHATDAAPVRVIGALVSLLVTCAVVWWSARALTDRVDSARFPNAFEWTSGWPPLAVGLVVVALVLGVLRRTSLPALAASVCTGALFTTTLAELPYFQSNTYVGDGPFLMPVYVVIIGALTLYVAAGPRSHPDHQRIVLALLFACTANTRLFVRESTATVALLTCIALLGVVSTPLPQRVRAAFANERLVRLVFGGAVFLGLWLFLCIFTGDSATVGTRSFQSVLFGALLCWLLATGLDRAGIERAIGVLLLGVLACLVIAAYGLADAASTEGWSRALATRLRVFQSHPNIIGPYFAGAAVLTGVLLLWRRADARAAVGIVRRGALLALCVGSLCALYLTQSRASQIACFVGFAAAAAAFLAPYVRRPGRWHAGAAIALVLGAGLLFTPLAEPLHERLEAKTFDGSSAVGQRYHFWRMASQAIASAPIFGVGPGQNYVHAQYAQPSYYDDARQTHHAHNVFLYVAEGSGLPSLIVFVALLFGVVELYRRVLVRLPIGERALPAALVGVPIGILASNMLDLGQVQPTYLPLYFWSHLGLAVAFTSTLVPDAVQLRFGKRSLPLAAAALVCVVPFGALPLLSDAYIQGGRLAAFTTREDTPAAEHAKNERALGELVLGRNLFPAHLDAGDFEPTVLEFLEGTVRAPKVDSSFDDEQLATMVLEAYRRECRDEPGNSAAWFDLARRALKSGEVDEAGPAIERALALDPRGHRVGEVHLVRVWYFLSLGDETAAAEALRQAALHQGSAWNIVPHTLLAMNRPGNPKARRLVFQVETKAGGLAQLDLDKALEWLGQRTLEIAAEKPIEARRHLLWINDGYTRQFRPEDALAWFQRYRASVPQPMPSVLLLEYDLLKSVGRRPEAYALVEALTGSDRAAFEQEMRTQRIFENPQAQSTPQGLAQLDESIVPIANRDIFFEAGMHREKFLVAAGIYASAGRWDDAVQCARRFMRDFIEFKERRVAFETMLRQRLLPVGLPLPHLLDLLELYLPEFNVDERRSGGKSEFVDTLAGELAADWGDGSTPAAARIRARLEDLGPAGAGLVQRLEKRGSRR
jgi:O-antigen ligase/tetratricopeptide (TPR) repeat protein